jgi:glycosyltransferase involved in cell wall biosynthesis
MPPTFSVIIPTGGRRTLARTLGRLRQADKGDIEVIVVSDGPQPGAAALTHDISRKWPNVRFVEGPRTGRWGNAQRQVALALARGEYLLFIDDDDGHTLRAFRHIRKAVRSAPGRIVIFRMRRHGEIYWKQPILEEGNVGTPEFLIPNIPGRLGSWVDSGERYQADFDFLSGCVRLQGDPIWNHRVIALAPLPRRRDSLSHTLRLRNRIRAFKARRERQSRSSLRNGG